MSKTATVRFLTCLVVPAALLLGACAKTITVKTEFPEPVIQPLPLKVGVYYSEDFSHYTYSEDLPDDAQWTFNLGDANKQLFNSIFSSLFNIISIVSGPGGPDPSYANLDAVIVPAIDTFEFSLPRQSHSEQFAVWIRYNLHIYTPGGTLITSWPVSAYGQSDEQNFGTSAAMQEAVIMAMRDAAANIVIGFAKEPKIKEALLSGDSEP